MNTQERTRISVTFGLDDKNEQSLRRFVDRVEKRLTVITGGAQRHKHEGSWRADGNGERPYTERHTSETCYTITFVTDDTDEDMLSEVKRIIRTVEDRFPNDRPAPVWVNVELEDVRCHHFDATV